MVQLLKIKEHIYRFIGKYEIYAMKHRKVILWYGG